jgi:hypothetical protein
MSYEENLKSFSADADASIGIYTGVPGMPGSANPNGGKQYCALRYTGAHQVGLNTAGRSVADGVTNGTTTVTSATAAFTAADVGRPVSGTDIPANTTIASVTNGTTVVLSQAATGTHSGNSFVLATAATVGVLQNKPQTPGMAATCGYQGFTNGIAGAAISAGAEVVPDSAGRFVPGVAAGPGLRFISREVASTVGELVALQII